MTSYFVWYHWIPCPTTIWNSPNTRYNFGIYCVILLLSLGSWAFPLSGSPLLLYPHSPACMNTNRKYHRNNTIKPNPIRNMSTLLLKVEERGTKECLKQVRRVIFYGTRRSHRHKCRWQKRKSNPCYCSHIGTVSNCCLGLFQIHGIVTLWHEILTLYLVNWPVVTH